MIIGVADSMGSEQKYQWYLDWLCRGRSDLEIVKLSYLLENAGELSRCDGLLLTGGGDVDPSAYGAAAHPKTRQVDAKRDTFERSLLDEALKNDLPILGICRGLQIANVHLGGSLIQDLCDAGHPGHESSGEIVQTHDVAVTPGSMLAAMIGETAAGRVNSYHHQAAERLGSGLRAVATSPDGIIEALEHIQLRSFFLLLQWHPERMKEENGNLFSSTVAQSFCSACTVFSHT